MFPPKWQGRDLPQRVQPALGPGLGFFIASSANGHGPHWLPVLQLSYFQRHRKRQNKWEEMWRGRGKETTFLAIFYCYFLNFIWKVDRHLPFVDSLSKCPQGLETWPKWSQEPRTQAESATRGPRGLSHICYPAACVLSGTKSGKQSQNSSLGTL